MQKLVLLIYIIIFVAGCTKDKSTVPIEGRLLLSFNGISNFGKILIGQNRFTTIKLSNNMNTPQKTPNLNPVCPNSTNSQCPFTLNINNCPELLAPGASCGASIKFSPIAMGTFQQSIDPNGFNLIVSGQGVILGSLSLVGDSFWEIGPIVAGHSVSKDFTLTNIGESDIPSPIIANTNDFYKYSTTCEATISPGKQCIMTVIFNRQTAKDSIDDIQFLSTADNIVTATAHSTVTPSFPDGVIEVSYRNSMTADGVDEQTITILKVPDIFGNKVLSSQNITAIATNAVFIDSTGSVLPSPLIVTTVNGVASFKIRSTIIKAPITIDLSSTNAYKKINIKSLAGKPAAITLKPFLNTLNANGVSSTTIQTLPILDQNGSIVEDGTKVFFNHNGQGSIDPAMALTFQGVAYTKLTAPTSIGSEVIEVKSEDGTITSGLFTVNYIPGPPAGSFAVTPTNNVIYYKNDPSGSKLDSTMINVGPIKDIYSQNVGVGYNMDVVIYNGWVKGTNGLSNFKLSTDSNSMASFNVESNGYIGDIRIEVTVKNLGMVSATIHASSDQKIKYSKSGVAASLYKTYGPMKFDIDNQPNTLIPNDMSLSSPGDTPGKAWRRLYHVDALVDTDDLILGQTTYSSDSPILTNYVFPKILGLDCLQNINETTALFPCFYNKRFGSSSWGNSGFYIFGKDGMNSVTQSVLPSYDIQLGNPDNHGSFSTIFPTQIYSRESDQFYTFGGLQFSRIDNYVYDLKYNTVTSAYSNAKNVNSSYDGLSYQKNNLISHPGTILSSTTESENYGKFIYGGFKIPTNLEIYSLDNSISRVFTEPTTGFDQFEKLVISPDQNGFSPDPKLLSGFYYDDDTDDVYLIGGLRKSGFNYFFDDTIWKFNFKASPKKWLKVCDQCGLPNKILYNNFVNLLNFPSWSPASIPVNFEEIQSVVSKTYVYHSNDGKIYMLYDGSTSGEAWALNLNYSTNQLPLVSVAPAGIANMSKSRMLRYNQYSGRLYGFLSGSNMTDNSTVSFYETPSSTKQYYLSKFNLGQNSKQTVLELKFTINAYGEDATLGSKLISCYIYNFNTNKYELMGQSTNQNNQQAKDYPLTISIPPTGSPSDYVSLSGHTYLMTTSGGNQSQSGNGSGNSVLKINNAFIEGVW